MGRCAYGETGLRDDGDVRVYWGVNPGKGGCHPCKGLQASYTIMIASPNVLRPERHNCITLVYNAGMEE